jgi:hypothetical protein
MTAALLDNQHGDDELTASQVLCRVMGFGALEADLVLREIDVQDRTQIVECYNAGRINEIHSIIESVGE